MRKDDPFGARFRVSNIRIFGSVARGDAVPESDIDLLVDFEVGDSGLDLIRLRPGVGTAAGGTQWTWLQAFTVSFG